MDILSLIVGVATGFVVAFLWSQLKLKSTLDVGQKEQRELEIQQVQLNERVAFLRTENEKLKADLKTVEHRNELYLQQQAKADAEFANLQEKLATQKQEM